MKKMMIALVAMFVMTMSANAQSENTPSLTFERMSNYLELTAEQLEPVKTAMAQFTSSMEAINQLKDPTKGLEAWQKIQARHKATMKNILSEKQFNKYEQMLDLTAKNTAERMAEGAQANR
ncbi:MAG: hypothetical protein IJ256_06790 [Bacteroidaceae bacterium]|nr:hypothetical protein [Bacteroidaceae bacterium]